MTRRLPFLGSRYERNWPTRWPAAHVGLPVRVTVLRTNVTYFAEPGILVSMPWDYPGPPPDWRTTDEVKFNMEQFLENFHPIDNVVALRHADGVSANPKED